MLPVLIREGKLGDVVLLGSVTASLGACVVATDPRYHPVVRALKGVSRVIALSQVRHESGPRFDLQGRLRTRWLAGLRGRGIRKQSVRRRAWLLGVMAPRRRVVDQYARTLGVEPAPLPWIDVHGPRDALGLAPGAAFAPKRWNVERFAGLAARWPGKVVVFGGPGEEALVRTVCSANPQAIPVVERGFARTLRALGHVHTMVANDSGLMHLAGASGARVVALFGPTHTGDGFFAYPGVALERRVACRPCGLHRVERCHAGHHRCMDHTVEDVLGVLAS